MDTLFVIISKLLKKIDEKYYCAIKAEMRNPTSDSLVIFLIVKSIIPD